jgi:tRNA-2-methylthio-N6-dimethylallyladenosine synthase
LNQITCDPSEKKIFIKTWGCQMNSYESLRIANILAPFGYKPVAVVEKADVVVLNTCHIREKAADKVFSELGRLKTLKATRSVNPMLIAVSGCVAQAEGEEIFNRAPYVDIVFGPQTWHCLPDMINQALLGKRVINVSFSAKNRFSDQPTLANLPGPTAFLPIQEGCNRFCSFCVVPYTRGIERSRPAAAILAEARQLISAGVIEITVLGQNVNAWHGQALSENETDRWSLTGLLLELAKLDGLARIRYITSHPCDMDEELITAHGRIPQLIPHLHLPVQSGADRILKAMNRQHTTSDYRRLVDRLRQVRPDLALSSDFIVGFPGETDRDFAETLHLVADIGFAQAYSFKYSPRPGTPAADYAKQVPEPVKAERLASLRETLDAQRLAFNLATKGTDLPVMFYRKGKDPKQWLGRSPYMQTVLVETNSMLYGRIASVHIREVHLSNPNSLVADLHENSEEMSD